MSKKDKKRKERKLEKEQKNNAEELMDELNETTDSEDIVEEKGEEKISETDALAELQSENQELKDKYLRLFAEFDNYKKRTIKEKIDFMQTAAQETLSALLPVLDDFDRAKKNASDENSVEVFTEGVQLVYQKLYTTLSQKGLTPMETDGQEFNPEFHEAITEVPAPTKEMKGKVIDTIEKGYKLKNKIIRHAKVVVGK